MGCESIADSESLSIPTTAGFYIQRGGADFVLIQVFNDDPSNLNDVFVSISGQASTTPTAGSGSVRLGQRSAPFSVLLDSKSNPNGVSAIAATGATRVTVVRTTFPDAEAFYAAVAGFAAAAVSLNNIWVVVSGTVVQLNASWTEARADTFDSKTAANGVRLGASMPAGGVGVGSVALAAASARLGVGTTYMDLLAASAAWIRSGTSVLVANSTKSYFNGLGTGTGLEFDAADGTDTRHTLSSTARVLHTPVAGGAINSAQDCLEVPIVNAAVVAVGNIVELAGGGANACQAAAAGSTRSVLGIAVAGGTGNAGQTVFARVAFFGIYFGLLADTTGTVEHQFVRPGGTTADRVESTATPIANSFGKALTTAVSGGACAIALRGLG